MTAVAVEQRNYVARALRENGPDLAYPLDMPHASQDDPTVEDPRRALAHIIVRAREAKGWTQDDLAEASGVSRATVQRLENAKGAAAPETLRGVFLALTLDPRRIPVILGYVTAHEMGLADEPTPLRTVDPTIEEVLGYLEDPDLPAEKKEEWIAFIRFQVERGKATRTAG